MASDDDSSSSSSSASDDEFLTGGGPGSGGISGQDREAIVRKKLLESFYGAAAVAAAEGSQTGDVRSAGGSVEGLSGAGSRLPSTVASAASLGAAAETPASPRSDARASPADVSLLSRSAGVTRMTSTNRLNRNPAPALSRPGASDLDSPHFDAPSFCLRHIRSSSAHGLLEADERLALDIRSLDSTMQTLVYENYSKFIDATDAIRSIGQSVDSSEAGLRRLRSGIGRIEEGTRAVDAALRRSRDAVAEKLRVKRLLSRLDALLRLPTTLRTQINAGRYRLAAESHRSATAILGRHSAGFESLKSIEAECDGILRSMIQNLRRKLMHWSGEARRRGSPLLRRRKHILQSGVQDRITPSVLAGVASADDDEYGDDEVGMGILLDDDYEEEASPTAAGATSGEGYSTPERKRTPPPLPPISVAEIFECAGTLLLFASPPPFEEGSDNFDRDSCAGGGAESDEGLTADDCKSLALNACCRLLERSLDAQRETESEEGGIDARIETGVAPYTAIDNAGASIIPTAYLDGILESATLYGVTLSGTGVTALAKVSPESVGQSGLPRESVMTVADRKLMAGFVGETFGTFLGNVRMAFLEKSLEGGDITAFGQQASETEGDTEGEDAGETIFAEIFASLSLLLRSVRELASGLALPEVVSNWNEVIL